MLPKLIITDIDGVWTDGGMFYDQEGNELKKFNTYDSAGVLWCKLNKIPVVVITGENTHIVKRRVKKLNIEYLFSGVSNKVKTLETLFEELNVKWEEVAFIGDDINDFFALQNAGYSACPSNAPDYIKSIVDDVLPCRGGDGVFRMFVENILNREGVMKSTLELYFKTSNNQFNQ